MEAGNQVRWFARQLGWPLKRYNILVEGETDCQYLILANRFFEIQNARTLLGKDISIFPTGKREDGGTFGLIRYFPTIRQLIDLDVDDCGKSMFRAIALVDSDSAGKDAVKILTSKYTRLVVWRDIFLVLRRLPRETRDVRVLPVQVERANRSWKRWDCKTEDLLDYNLLSLYKEERPQAISRLQRIGDGEHMVKILWEFKIDLLRFCSEHGDVTCMRRHIELLQSLRFFLGLDPEGDIV